MDVFFRNVTKRFGSSLAVENLTLEIKRGEFVVLLGPSGCGKTTTLRMLAGLEDATSGDILVGGKRVNNLSPQQRDMAMVFQSYALYPHMTVAENIAYPLRVRKLPADSIKTQVEQVATMLQIYPMLGRKPRDLSGGERQRVALARAIVRQPQVFLMDEPLSNLDARLRLQMRGELKHLQYQLGITTVYVTHDQAEAMTLGHRVAVMRAGRLQQFDTPLTIYNQPVNRFVAEFVGSPGMNFLEGKIDRQAGLFVTDGLMLRLENSPLKMPIVTSDQRVTLGIRPEQFDISSTEHDGWLRANVYVTESMGNETFVYLQIGAHQIVVRAAGNFRAEVGAEVSINIQLDQAHFFDTETGLRIG